jgi:prohibitin 2
LQDGLNTAGQQLPATAEQIARMGKRNFKTAMYAAAAVVIFFVITSFITTVPASHFGIVTLWGEVTETVLTEGLHFVNPFVKVHKISVGLDTAKTENTEAASKDLQTVHTSVTVNFRVNPAEVRKLYVQNPNLQYESQYVVPAIKEILKAVTSHYTAEELVTKRTEVSGKIREQLATKLAGYHLLVQDINITNFDFSKAFNESIESKVRATQEAERAQRDLERVKFEAEQKIVTAKANAQAIKIQAEAINSAGGASFVQLEAIKKWDGKLPTYTGGAPVPFLNVGK